MSGGVERRRLELARRLDPSKFEQRIVCLNGQADLLDGFESAGTRVDNLRSDLGISAIAKASAIARDYKAEIIHGAVFEGVILATAAAMSMPKSRLVIEEIDYPIHRSWRGNLLLRALSTRADVCVGVSPAVMEYLARVARIPPSKLRLIVNGISAPSALGSADCDQLRLKLGIPPEAFVIGSVGRLRDDHKRFSDLITATQMLRQSNPEVHLLIVGEGPDLGLLKQKCAELQLHSHVTFAGYHSDVGRMFSIMDLFALVSERESFGLVLAEAMFSGLAVVATRAGGIPNVVAEGETALLVPVADPLAIVAAIARLLTDHDLRSAFARAGKARAEARFGALRYVGDVERVYLGLACGRLGTEVWEQQHD